MSLASIDVARAQAHAPSSPRALSVALLGFGCIGSAVARLLAQAPGLQIRGALVRHPDRPRPDAPAAPFRLTSDPDLLLASGADVVVEVLGGIEPARSIVRAALERGIPVVTANKSLMAACGDELLDAAARAGVPLLYEASVIAGVPFLGAFASRRRASAVSRLTGIVNGTSNFVLSRMAGGGIDIADAVAEAQRLGYAEPDPAADLSGTDAREKLVVLLRHFGFGSVVARDIELTGIDRIAAIDFSLARSLGGAIKPVVHADCHDGGVQAFVGPAFVPFGHRLAGVGGVENAICLAAPYGDIFHAGPGAGPTATATTILDDVVEAAAMIAAPKPASGVDRTPRPVVPPITPWYVRMTPHGLASSADLSYVMGSYGIAIRRQATAGSPQQTSFLTSPCNREGITAALSTLHDATATAPLAIRAIEE